MWNDTASTVTLIAIVATASPTRLTQAMPLTPISPDTMPDAIWARPITVTARSERTRADASFGRASSGTSQMSFIAVWATTKHFVPAHSAVARPTINTAQLPLNSDGWAWISEPMI